VETFQLVTGCTRRCWSLVSTENYRDWELFWCNFIEVQPLRHLGNILGTSWKGRRQRFDIRALLAGCSMQSDQMITFSALAGHTKFKGGTCILHMYNSGQKKFRFCFVLFHSYFTWIGSAWMASPNFNQVNTNCVRLAVTQLLCASTTVGRPNLIPMTWSMVWKWGWLLDTCWYLH